MHRPLAVLAAALVAAPLLSSSPGAPPVADGGRLDRAAVERSVAGALDPRVDPCDDFYRYACGGWLAGFELPADKPIYTRSFTAVHDANRELLRRLVEQAAADPAASGDRGRIGTFYGACMDEPVIAARGAEPLAPWLAKIDGATTPAALLTLGAELQAVGAGAFFGVDVDGDLSDPTTVVAHLLQGGLGLPEREYYLADDAERAALRDAYRAHVAGTLERLGAPADRAAAEAAAILAFESELARASRPVERMRVYDELHNPHDAAALAALAPELPWKELFAALGRPDVASANVMTPEFFPALARLVAATDPATVRAYLRYQLVTGTATLLSDALYLPHFDFYGRRLSGQKEPQPRWRRCVAATEEALAEPLGRLYVAERFGGDSKQIALEMIGDLTDAFEASLPGLEWMDEPTRRAAIEKKSTLRFKVGYPDAWRDDAPSEAAAGRHFENTLAARRAEFARQLAKVGKPYDVAEWTIDPQVVNAGYHPLRNDHTYPAGILQPPFFHRDFPTAMNYGAIGWAIGHELTHGFDDQGRKFDARGRLADWWTSASVAGFEERAACIRDQYSGYEVEPGVPVNGALTLGENIGDNGGLKQAWAAFQRRKAANPAVDEGLAGLTADQLFFVAAAQVWCNEASPEFQRLLVQTDEHAPGEFRVNGTMVNHPAFGPAFSCPVGKPMNPAMKCAVW